MTLSSQVITQQVVSFLNVGRIACLDWVKTSFKILLFWPSLLCASSICISSLERCLLKDVSIRHYGYFVTMLCHISYWRNRHFLIVRHSMLSNCCLVTLIIPLTLSISCLQAHFEIWSDRDLKLIGRLVNKRPSKWTRVLII
jgi:hypothetical protein